MALRRTAVWAESEADRYLSMAECRAAKRCALRPAPLTICRRLYLGMCDNRKILMQISGYM